MAILTFSTLFLYLIMSTHLIRSRFLDYFKRQGHVIVPSSSVIPHDDPTLLFNNAGMNQFKDVFLGLSHRDYDKAVSSQKCIRVGGKHNDLENVGHTSRHLTFFEMLGNFSFGSYFKEESIRFAWEVSTEIFGFDPNRLWPSVFREDDEAFELWTQYVPTERITRLDEKDNFWAMGDTGPCGPCSELYFDRGAAFGDAARLSEDTTGNRYLEFWNLVFMQYNTLASGVRERLPKPSIDTGAGLERIMVLRTGVDSVFETDILRQLIAQIEQVTGVPYQLHENRSAAFRVIADHLRCLAFAIADGAQPSNVERGYILRKLLRRAVRYGRTLGMERPFLAQLLPALIALMGEQYPELITSQHRIAELLTQEEEGFIRTLKRGGNILNQVIEEAQREHRPISGEEAFKLKDTYGLPLEEITLIAKDAHLAIDENRYRLLEAEARERSRMGHKTVQQVANESIFAMLAQEAGASSFLGYTHTQVESSIVAIVLDGKRVNTIEAGQEGLIFLKETPFYAEMGGQVGDTGQLVASGISCQITACTSPYKGLIAHHALLQFGTLHVGDRVTAVIDTARRQLIANNHTATHLLHWALQQVLGSHVRQAGSVVASDRLRFDFSHHKALSIEECRQIEDLINATIRENRSVQCYEMPYEEVQQQTTIKQFFGEKYGTQVRVVDIDDSKELCGGTHTDRLGTIGLFRIAKEGSIAAGVRRIEAVTGQAAEAFCREESDLIASLAMVLKTNPSLLKERLETLLEEHRALTAEIKALRAAQLQQAAEQLMSQTIHMGPLSLLAAQTHASIDELRRYADLTMEQLRSGIVCLGTPLPEGRCQLIVKVSDEWISRGFSAHQLLKLALPLVEGSGGGKAQLAQGGGKDGYRLGEAIDLLKGAVAEQAARL